MMTLQQFQLDFANAIITGEPTSELVTQDIEGHGLQAEARIDIHRNNYKLSLEDVLLRKFTKVEKFVGEEFLRAVIRAFIKSHPPKDVRLSEYGIQFPDFWAGFEHTQELGYLCDLFRLELAVNYVQEMTHVEALRQGEWEMLAVMDDSEEVTLSLVPQNLIIKSDYPIFSLWLVASGQLPAESVNVDKEGQIVQILGKKGQVNIAVLTKAETSFIQALEAGQSLSEAYEYVTSTLGMDMNLEEILKQNAERGLFCSGNSSV